MIADNAKAIARVEEKVDNLDTRINGLDQRMSRIKGELGQIRQILLDRLPPK